MAEAPLAMLLASTPALGNCPSTNTMLVSRRGIRGGGDNGGRYEMIGRGVGGVGGRRVIGSDLGDGFGTGGAIEDETLFGSQRGRPLAVEAALAGGAAGPVRGHREPPASSDGR